MELISTILFLALVFGFILFFITRKDWRVLLAVVPAVFLIPFALQMSHDESITYQQFNLGCGQTSNTTFACNYYNNTNSYSLDAKTMVEFNYLVYLGVMLIAGYAVTEFFEKY